MPTRNMYWKVVCTSLGFSGLICAVIYAVGSGSSALLLGFLAGAGVLLVSQSFLFAGWRAAPNGKRVALYYGLRLSIIFGSILLAMALPFLDAVGVLVPQLFPTPVLAILLAMEKES